MFVMTTHITYLQIYHHIFYLFDNRSQIDNISGLCVNGKIYAEIAYIKRYIFNK